MWKSHPRWEVAAQVYAQMGATWGRDFWWEQGALCYGQLIGDLERTAAFGSILRSNLYRVLRWIGRLAEHGRGTALLHARTETEWFRICWQRATAMLFMAKG